MSKSVTNKRFPHHIKVYGLQVNGGDDDPFTKANQRKIVYKGVGRSFTDTTTTGDGKVIVNRRKASIPKVYSDFSDTNVILPDYMIEVTIGGYTEIGFVKDVEAGTMGTNIIWELSRN